MIFSPASRTSKATLPDTEILGRDSDRASFTVSSRFSPSRIGRYSKLSLRLQCSHIWAHFHVLKPLSVIPFLSINSTRSVLQFLQYLRVPTIGGAEDITSSAPDALLLPLSNALPSSKEVDQ